MKTSNALSKLAREAKRTTSVQTFLPDASFVRSATFLDPTRLANQRNEATAILNAVLEQDYHGVKESDVPWGSHPATRMWRGYASALARYGLVICLECRTRGIEDTVLQKIVTLQKEYKLYSKDDPWWLGNLPALHASHRSNLLLKWPAWYKAFNWPETGKPVMPYFWPVTSPIEPMQIQV